jgi:cytochrome c
MMTRKKLVAILAVSIAAVLLVIASTAYGIASDARAGRVFAIRNCAGCHAIGATGASPTRKAPTFRAVARKYNPSDLEEALAEGIVTGHNAMPEFVLTPQQIDDLLAHLKQLRRGG